MGHNIILYVINIIRDVNRFGFSILDAVFYENEKLHKKVQQKYNQTITTIHLFNIVLIDRGQYFIWLYSCAFCIRLVRPLQCTHSGTLQQIKLTSISVPKYCQT